ncbi:putative phospholipase A(2) [Helianthus debilis subsp. tardiflorus]
MQNHASSLSSISFFNGFTLPSFDFHSYTQLFCHFSFALKVDLGGDTGLSLSKECSKKCESSFCNVPPLLRYGKYCGLLYSGCPGEKPCDELDACCMKHDSCISANNSEY